MPCLSTYLSFVSSILIFPVWVNSPLLITLPSAHHSPSTVNIKASEFVMGTVRLNSAFPIKIKNHTLPVTFKRRGIA
jgi:hypothetical protein